MNENIDIVIASYNGGSYIREQINSIIGCNGFDKYVNRIIISDDNSSDSTLSIINSIDCEKITLINNGINKKGVVENFNNALRFSNADYIIFCDQDDVWLDNKIEILLAGILNLEKSKSIPSLFFTDLYVVDQNLKVISESFWSYQEINPKTSHNLYSVLFYNVSPGCAMIVNRALINVACPFPKAVLMHDFWLLLVAKSMGAVDYSKEKTFLYRQHTDNVIGSGGITFFKKINKLIKNSNDDFMKILQQVEELNSILPEESLEKPKIESIISIKKLSLMKRVVLFKNIFDKNQTLGRSLFLFLRMVTYR